MPKNSHCRKPHPSGRKVQKANVANTLLSYVLFIYTTKIFLQTGQQEPTLIILHSFNSCKKNTVNILHPSKLPGLIELNQHVWYYYCSSETDSFGDADPALPSESTLILSHNAKGHASRRRFFVFKQSCNIPP